MTASDARRLWVTRPRPGVDRMASAMGAVIDGLQLTYANDDELLAQGMTLFEALYRAFDQSARRAAPRTVARRVARKKKGAPRPPRGST